ncbi:MAG: ATP-dependent sacrificial sulfur transferase LarE [Lachnospiraceae bacterium]|nr:ATP-dependent sacrificial sulfur transferase LarE [Lachnospiraceae bacterium]
MDSYTKKDVAIAFSGGVDSSLLLKIACEKAELNHTKVYAYTIHTMLHPIEELELTADLAQEMGAVHQVIQVDELAEAGIENNPVNRCYLCKKCMFTKLITEMKMRNIHIAIDGTNLDDTKVYRPGIQALKELGVVSPLMMAGFTKQEVRTLAAQYEIAVSDRPSVPCMATRFPYGTKLVQTELDKVEQMEQFIKNMGFYNVRARIHDKLVRIEVDVKDIERVLEKRTDMISFAKKLGYDYISVDLEGFRSGSQDLHLV